MGVGIEKANLESLSKLLKHSSLHLTRASITLRFTARDLKCYTQEKMLSLYSSLMWLSLEDEVHFLSPKDGEDNALPERVQPRATKMTFEVTAV